MRVIPPITVTDAILTSCTAAEPLAPAAYNAGTTYALGAMVSVAGDYLIYQSLQAGNIGHTPNISPLYWESVGYIETAYNAGTTYALNDCVSYNHVIYQSLQAANTGNNPLISPLYWVSLGATNRWRALDTLRNTQTVQASPLTYVFAPGVRINAIAVLGLVADNIQITMVSGGITVYNRSQALISRQVLNWFDYFFKPFATVPSVAFFDLPPYSGATLTVTITRATGNVECGAICFGTYTDLGRCQYQAQSDALNFSTVDRDAFGNSILLQRRSVPKTQQQVWALATAVDSIRDVRTALNAVPAVWSGLDDTNQPYFEALLILGFYRTFTIDLDYENYAVSTIELEEV